jgi:hypothetical protein
MFAVHHPTFFSLPLVGRAGVGGAAGASLATSTGIRKERSFFQKKEPKKLLFT